MSLRSTLEAAASIPPAGLLQPTLVRQTATRISRQFGDTTGKPPAPFVLDDVLGRVREVWTRERSFESLGRRDLRWLPYLLFYPVSAPEQWLARHRRFVDAFLEHVRADGRALATSASELLRYYPRELATFPTLRDRLAGGIEADRSPRTETWRERHRAYGVLARNGPERVASRLIEDEQPVSDILQGAGLTDDIGGGAFAREVNAALLKEVYSCLQRRPGPEALQRPLAFLTKRGGGLRFEDQAPGFGDAMLLPYVGREPVPATRAKIESLLLAHLKDPRLWPQKWQRTHPDAKALFLRWLVGATLEDFFRLIEKNAWMQHWQYRRAFWTAYLKKGYIQDAWVVLGEHAQQLTRRAFMNEHLAYGRLTGGDKNHSVLLLRIDKLTIAEWSHNGKCRFWLARNSAAPPMHHISYTRGELTSEPDHEKAHHGSEHYTWQLDLAAWIAQRTGARVHQADYAIEGKR